MQYRDLHCTGGKVSEIGFGAWGIGGTLWLGGNDRDSLAALHTAIDEGVTYIDTALAYGDGHSEQLIGEVCRNRSENLCIATKIPPLNQLWPARSGIPLSEVFPPAHIRASTIQSLENLGVEALALQQLHVWREEWIEDLRWLEELEQLKQEGKIRAIGISITDHEPDTALAIVKQGVIDVVQVIYNIFDQTPQQNLFPFCQERGIGIVARCPFDEGSLTGMITPQTSFPENDWRNRYFKDNRTELVAEHLEPLTCLLGQEASTLAELSLRFCLSHPAVTTVIPGMRKVSHVLANTQVSDGQRLSEDLLRTLARHAWKKNFYQ